MSPLHRDHRCRRRGRPIGRLLLALTLAAGIALCALPAVAQQNNGELPNDQAQVLTRGPMHEAFAEQYNLDPTPGVVVSKQPPEPIDELPPASMPAGEHVTWIPGYWAWDDSWENFIWVSGVWRDIPLGQRWVPGTWDEVQQGWQWMSGFWTAAEQRELSYQPMPPQSLEQGPNVAAPSENHF